MAMKLVSLKLSPKEAKTEGALGAVPAGSSDRGPKYPYDTRVRLGTEELKKLGIDIGDYRAGQKCDITAKAEVIGTSTRQRQGDDDHQELELQLTDIAIDWDKADKKAKADDDHLDAIGEPAKKGY